MNDAEREREREITWRVCVWTRGLLSKVSKAPVGAGSLSRVEGGRHVRGGRRGGGRGETEQRPRNEEFDSEREWGREKERERDTGGRGRARRRGRGRERERKREQSE